PMALTKLSTTFQLDGTLHLIWNFNSPLDILDGWGKFSLTENLPRFQEVVVNKQYWKVQAYDDSPIAAFSDSGVVSKWKEINTVSIEKETDEFVLKINGDQYWKGSLPQTSGLAGISLNPHSYVAVDNFELEGTPVEGKITYGYYEALLNAGNQDSAWTFVKDSSFFLGRGAVAKKDSAI